MAAPPRAVNDSQIAAASKIPSPADTPAPRFAQTAKTIATISSPPTGDAERRDASSAPPGPKAARHHQAVNSIPAKSNSRGRGSRLADNATNAVPVNKIEGAASRSPFRSGRVAAINNSPTNARRQTIKPL